MTMKKCGFGTSTFILCAVLALAFSWGSKDKNKKASVKPEQKKETVALSSGHQPTASSAPGTPQKAYASPANITGKNAALDEKEKLQEARRIASGIAATMETKSQIEKILQAKPQSVAAVKNLKTTRAEVERLQQDLKNIIQLNEQLKPKYKEQKEQLQKIGEWTKINQKILQDIKSKTAKPSKSAYKIADTEEILRQEKLRFIQQETEKKRATIQKMQDENTTVPAANAAPKAPAEKAAGAH